MRFSLEPSDEELIYFGFGSRALYQPGFDRGAVDRLSLAAVPVQANEILANIHDQQQDEQQPSLFLYGSAEQELIEGGSGSDWVFYTDSDAGIVADLSTFAPASGGYAEGDIFVSIENIVGSAFADTLIGNDADNIIRGDGGDDILLGGVGADAIDGGTGLDMASYVNSQSGVSVHLSIARGYGGDAEGDSLSAIEQIQGSDFDDHLSGDAADNMLFGMEGDDILIGRGGNDILSGAGGADIFLFNSGFGQDVIEDFELGIDLMVFSDATSMESFIFEQDGDDTIIRFAGGEDFVRLAGVDMAALSEADFLFFDPAALVSIQSGGQSGGFDIDPSPEAGYTALDSVFSFI